MKQFDAIIIGFGKGGKTLAAELAKREQKVAVIERSDKMYVYQHRLHSDQDTGSSVQTDSCR